MSAGTRDQPKAPSWLVAASLLAVYVIWGTTYFAIKVAIQGAPPFFLMGYRFLAAGFLLLAWQGLRRRPMPTARQWRGAALIGFLLLVIGNGGVAVAEHWVSSGATVALISVMPLATALWSGAFGAWPRRLEWAAIALGSVGAAVMLLGRDMQASLLGTAIILFGTLSWSLGTVLSRRLDIPHGPTGFGAEMLTAGLMMLGVSALIGEHWAVPHSPHVVGAWLYLTVFGSMIGFSAYRYVVEHVSPTLASTYAYVNPPVALLVGWWLGNESFAPNTLIGLPIVLGAVALLAWIQSREPQASIAGRDAGVRGSAARSRRK